MATQDPNKELFLDMLTKDEKEALLTKKMESIRKQNEALLRRHEEVEADKQKAVWSKLAAQKEGPSLQKASPPVTNDHDPRRRRPVMQQHQGQQQQQSITLNQQPQHLNTPQQLQHQQQNSRPPVRGKAPSNGIGKGLRERPKSQDFRSEVGYEYEPIVDMADIDYRLRPSSPSKRDLSPNKARRNPPRDSACGLSGCSGDATNAIIREFRNQPKRQGWLYDTSSHTEDNAANGHERQSNGRVGTAALYSQTFSNRKGHGRVAATEGPPPDPTYNFLSDRSRESANTANLRYDKNANQAQDDDSRSDNNRGSLGGKDLRRHPRNFGGADFGNVKTQMKAAKEKERDRRSFPPRNRLEMSLNMTGTERVQYDEWKAERQKVDQERLERHKTSAGEWRRAWDQEKAYREAEELQSQNKTEPAKRPVGRIGSGRFDRGDREDRRALDTVNQNSKVPVPAVQAIQSPEIPEQKPIGAGGQSRGRGRGRGRSRGQNGTTGSPGEKPLRPRTWSGGDEARTVECSNDMLVVKIDKARSSNDHSVEVEYGDDEKVAEKWKSSPIKKKSGRKSPNKPQRQQQQQMVNSLQFQDAEAVSAHRATLAPSPSLPGSRSSQDSTTNYKGRPASLSQSVSIGSTGTDEWEDITGTDSCATTTEDESEAGYRRARLARLNPDAPVFLPTSSPDLSISPPAHLPGFDLSLKEQRLQCNSSKSLRLSQGSSQSFVNSKTSVPLVVSAAVPPSLDSQQSLFTENFEQSLLTGNVEQSLLTGNLEHPMETENVEQPLVTEIDLQKEYTVDSENKSVKDEQNKSSALHDLLEASEEVEPQEEEDEEEENLAQSLEDYDDVNGADPDLDVEADHDDYDMDDVEDHSDGDAVAAVGSSLADELSAAGRRFSPKYQPDDDYEDEDNENDVDGCSNKAEPEGEALPSTATSGKLPMQEQSAQEGSCPEAPDFTPSNGCSQVVENMEKEGLLQDLIGASLPSSFLTALQSVADEQKVMENQTEEPGAPVSETTDCA